MWPAKSSLSSEPNPETPMALSRYSKYVPESARFAGCLEICIQQNQDDPNDIISNQYWETRKHYEDYFTWRTKEGVGAELQSLCSEPTSARFFTDVIEAKAPTTV